MCQQSTILEQQVVTLESEVKRFAEGLPYWAKFLAEKVLSGNVISHDEIDSAYSYLLEELDLEEKTEKPAIMISPHQANSSSYKPDLLFTQLENVEGVNALSENQKIEFCPNLTIIYGANGSGKSGYVRLLKKIFYSKSPEDIVKNVHLSDGHKPISANLIFQSDGADIPLNFPGNSESSEFEQFAVFDNGSVKHHLTHKNEFEFRPSGFTALRDLLRSVSD